MPQPLENMTQHARLLITDYKVVKNQMGETRHFMSLFQRKNGSIITQNLVWNFHFERGSASERHCL